MHKDSITTEISNRICNHMNKDHKEALATYAREYAGIQNPGEVTMVEINSRKMKLEVNTQIVEISFDHVLADSEDAHKTLVAMLRQTKNA